MVTLNFIDLIVIQEGYLIYCHVSFTNLQYLWNILPTSVREKIVKVGFKTYIESVPFAERDRKLAFTMKERLWDTKNMFHLLFREVKLTPLDFSSITGLRVFGKKILWDLIISGRHEYIQEKLGWILNFT